MRGAQLLSENATSGILLPLVSVVPWMPLALFSTCCSNRRPALIVRFGRICHESCRYAPMLRLVVSAVRAPAGAQIARSPEQSAICSPGASWTLAGFISSAGVSGLRMNAYFETCQVPGSPFGSSQLASALPSASVLHCLMYSASPVYVEVEL